MWSATEAALKPSLVATRMPCSVSAGRSSQSVPVPDLCRNCRSGQRFDHRAVDLEPGDPPDADGLGAVGLLHERVGGRRPGAEDPDLVAGNPVRDRWLDAAVEDRDHHPSESTATEGTIR